MNSLPQQPIGMLDSGLGGLTVLAACRRMLPNEHFVYFADLLHSPYGGRNRQELLGLIQEIVKTLREQYRIKALVLASNTSTSAAVDELRAGLDLPVIGMEPALKPAVHMMGPDGQVLVLATELTLNEEKFQRLYAQYKHHAKITLLSCPGLVELIDRGVYDGPELEQYLAKRFQPLDKKNIHAVVLGCTHYVLVRDPIMRHFTAAECVDGNLGVARQTRHVLEEQSLINPLEQTGHITLISSDPSRLSWLQEQFMRL